jgi:hypothetical protein
MDQLLYHRLYDIQTNTSFGEQSKNNSSTLILLNKQRRQYSDTPFGRISHQLTSSYSSFIVNIVEQTKTTIFRYIWSYQSLTSSYSSLTLDSFSASIEFRIRSQWPSCVGWYHNAGDCDALLVIQRSLNRANTLFGRLSDHITHTHFRIWSAFMVIYSCYSLGFGGKIRKWFDRACLSTSCSYHWADDMANNLTFRLWWICYRQRWHDIVFCDMV